MTAARLFKISLIILISLCFITTFSFMTACKDDVGETEEDLVEAEETTEEEETEEEMEEEEAAAGYMDVTAAESKELIDNNPDLIIIDVSPKYDDGHLPGATNYYIGDGSLDDAIPTLDKEAKYLVYCHTDAASIPGAQKLVDAGFMTVYRLEGNYAAWVDAGYEIETTGS
jgi:rhodanese-related sulfurtransferase